MRCERRTRETFRHWLGIIGLATLCATAPEPMPQHPADREPDASSDEQRVEPQKGIRPPWREPLIPEKRNETPKRKRGWPV